MLALLAMIFVGMAAFLLEVALGVPHPDRSPVRENGWQIVGPLALAAAVLVLGVYIPADLRDALARAAEALGGSAP
jgi:hypothetical protein